MRSIDKLRHLLETHGIYRQAVKLMREHVNEAMGDDIQPGDTIEINRGGRLMRGRVIRAAQNGMGGRSDWDIHFELETPVPGRIGPGRWKQGTDGGTVRVVQKAGGMSGGLGGGVARGGDMDLGSRGRPPR